MSASEKLPRPPQVTLVGWLIVIGSLFVVFTAFEALGSVRSLESLQRIEEYFDDGPGASLGWSIETGVQAMRIASTVTAACAAATAVLGWFVLRRHHGARIAVTVLAVPLFFSGAVTGGFVSSMVAAAAVLLWLQPSRDWFNGKPMATPQRTRREDTTGAQRSTTDDVWGSPVLPPDPGRAAEGGARPVQGFGNLPDTQTQQAEGQWVGPYATYATPPTQAPAPARRPGAVVIAVVITFFFAAFFLISALSTLGLLATSQEQVLEQLGPQRDELLQQGLEDADLVTFIRLSVAVLVVVSVTALTGAVMALRRNSVGRTLVVVIAALAAGFWLLSAFVAPIAVVPGLAALVVIMMLLRPDVRAWFNAPR